MADYVEGKVLKATSKPTSSGGKVYNIQVDSDEGQEWFGCGFDDPRVNQGDVIGFDIEYVGDYTNVNLDTLEIIEQAPKRQSSSRGSNRGSRNGSRQGNSSRSSSRGKPSGSSRGGRDSGSAAPKRGGGKKEVDWDRKDNLIRLQSSQNTAIAMVGMLLANGAVTLPSAKAKKLDAAVALVEKEASRLFDKYTDIVDGVYDKGEPEQEEYDDDDVPE